MSLRERIYLDLQVNCMIATNTELERQDEGPIEPEAIVLCNEDKFNFLEELNDIKLDYSGSEDFDKVASLVSTLFNKYKHDEREDDPVPVLRVQSISKQTRGRDAGLLSLDGIVSDSWHF